MENTAEDLCQGHQTAGGRRPLSHRGHRLWVMACGPGSSYEVVRQTLVTTESPRGTFLGLAGSQLRWASEGQTHCKGQIVSVLQGHGGDRARRAPGGGYGGWDLPLPLAPLGTRYLGTTQDVQVCPAHGSVSSRTCSDQGPRAQHPGGWQTAGWGPTPPFSAQVTKVRAGEGGPPGVRKDLRPRGVPGNL